MVGLLIIPSLYAWFNIIANWNPYGNTSKLPIAVASVDKGTTIEGNSINAGQMVVDALKENHDMGWTFVSKDEAIEGVKSGEYYAAAVIPEDFSQNISSILTGTIKKPSIDYYLNEKKNAIANKMTDVGLETVQTKVNQTFVATITQVVGKFLNLSADKLSNQDPIDSLVQSLNALNKNLS
ncbi:MAG: YhgE/Pip family protein, partial [Eubacterium sp.]